MHKFVAFDDNPYMRQSSAIAPDKNAVPGCRLFDRVEHPQIRINFVFNSLDAGHGYMLRIRDPLTQAPVDFEKNPVTIVTVRAPGPLHKRPSNHISVIKTK